MISLTPDLVLCAFVVFCRVGSCLLVVPGFSSPRVPVQARLFIAIAISLSLTPLLFTMVQPSVSGAAPVKLVTIIVSEGLKGVLIGLLARIFFIALETMGMGISLSIGLTSAFGPMEDDESLPSIASLISLVAVLLIFVTNLHWEIFRGLAASYTVIPVDQSFDPRIGVVQLTDEATKTFLFTLRIASPFLAFSLIASFAIGLVNKLVPQIPVSFISAPFLLSGGLIIFYFTVRPALDLFTSEFGTWLRAG